MAEPKFTPGPWAVGQYPPTDDFRRIENHACVCDPETMALIATCGRADDRQSQIDADLISAAPDLYAACKAIVSQIDYLSAIWGQEGVTRSLMDQARAALAKARGEVPHV